ncbi:O-methyltransferase [Corynebacterium casei]|uniref:O-methyltransferase n=1 Tax=Corynebacterium casei TaxID=160386 RepID=UPI003F92482A
MTVQAYDALRTFIDSTSTESESLASARAHAEEFSLRIPDSSVGQLLTTLAASAAGEKVQTVAITPAASVVGLYLFDGLSDSGIVTCIDPEVEHQSHAKSTFRDAGYSPSRVRFLPSRPLDVMGRLATEAYHVIYADVPTLDLPVVIKAAWPLIARRGTLVLPDALLDATIADTSRTDRVTVAAREADEFVRSLEDAHVTRLPLGSGLTLVTKR